MFNSSKHSVFSGSRPSKSPADKFTFYHTCSLLSQYIKEKDSPETSCHSATTMELFPTIIKQRNPTTVDFPSPQSVYPLHSEVPTMVKSSAFKSMENEPKAAQLTIFYAGQVVVFDDFPAEKLEEIMSLAGKGISQSQKTSACAHTHNQQGNNPSFEANVSPQAPSRPIVCELPIARKASLHRFLSKRKDRIASKAPYQINNPNSASNKPAESMTWLGLGAQSTQF